MKTDKLIGQTLTDLAQETGMFWNPIRIFVLQGDNDDTGCHLTDAYSFKQAISAHPCISAARVVSANDFCCGDTVVRVKL